MRILPALALFSTLSVGLPISATAADKFLKPETEPWRKSRDGIPTLVANFASAIGCKVAVRRTDVAPWDSDAPDGRLDYLVLYVIDSTCSSGNKMDRSYFALVKSGDYGDYYVDAELSSPARTGAFPRYISRIYESGGKVYFEAEEIDFSKCSPRCLSRKVEGQIGLKNHQWIPLNTHSDNGQSNR